MPIKATKGSYDLIVQLLDAGWEVKEFNSNTVTLVPARPIQATKEQLKAFVANKGGYLVD